MALMDGKFALGDRVKIKTDNPGDLKRVPKYIKGKIGIVQRIHGQIVNRRDHRDERPALYSVVFVSNDLFPEASKKDKVFVDIFEDWMIPQ